MREFLRGSGPRFLSALAIFASCLFTPGNASAAKLTLDPSQVSLDGASNGIPGRLVDEQAAAGDPRSGSSAIPTSNWSSTSGSHVNTAIIDLGSSYRIERVYIFDANGTLADAGADFTVSAGSTTSGWTALFGNPLNDYRVWKGFPNNTANDVSPTGSYRFVDDPTLEFGVTTRYLRVVHPNGLAGMPELVVYGTPVSTAPQDVVLGKPATASSEYREGVDPDYTYPNPPALAVDGSDSTYWASSSSASYFTYLEVDLGGYYSLSRFDLEVGHTTGGAPAAFEVQVQNRGCWKTVPQTVVTSNPASARSHTFTVPAIVTDRIRFVCPNKGGSCRVRRLAAMGVPSAASAAAAPACESGEQVVRRSPAYDYAEFVPQGYDADPEQKFPLVIALHGITGEVLEADRSGLYPSAEGLVKQLKNPNFAADFPAVVVSPHCRAFGVQPNGNCTFSIPGLEMLWRDVISTYRVDPDRVYMTGLSRGGFVTLQYAALHAADLAAVVPIAAGLGLADDALECQMKDLPVFAAHGTRDTTVPVRDTFNLQTKLNVTCAPDHPKTAIRAVIGDDHISWDPIYADPRTYAWMFAQRASAKEEDATHHWPVVATSGSKTVILPAGASTTSTNVTGSATHPDGVAFERYSWLDVTNTSGALTTMCDSATSPNCDLTGLTQGTHKFRLVVRDANGFSGYKDLTITVKP
jgi:predicted esterase